MTTTEQLAIIGLGCRFGGAAADERSLWDVLLAADPQVGSMPASRWPGHVPDEGSAPDDLLQPRAAFVDGLEDWDGAAYGLTDAEALLMDPQHRLLMDAVSQALANALIPAPAVAGSSTGVFVGVSDSMQYAQLLGESGDFSTGDPLLATGNSASVAAGRIAYLLDTHGPAITVDTACSTSLVAVHLACQSLRAGECDLAIVATSSALAHPVALTSAYDIGMMARDGRCKTFGRQADGFGIGEGAGAIVLQRLADVDPSSRRVRAVIRGSAVNQDGRSSVLTAPSQPAQERVMTEALAHAGLQPSDIDFVEAHGSGTPLGDAVELQALHRVYGADREVPLPVGAAKSVVGHCFVAAGMVALIKVVLELEHQQLTPNADVGEPNPMLRRTTSVRPVGERAALPSRARGAISSFAWAGTNAHLIVESAAPVQSEPDLATSWLLPLAAGSETGLQVAAADLREFLDATAGPVTGVARAYVVAADRSKPVRRALVVDSRSHAVRALASLTLPVADRADDALWVTDVDAALVLPPHISSGVATTATGSAGGWPPVDLQRARFEQVLAILERLRDAGLEPRTVGGTGLGATAASWVFGDGPGSWDEVEALMAARAGTDVAPAGDGDAATPAGTTAVVGAGAIPDAVGEVVARYAATLEEAAEHDWNVFVGALWERSGVDLVRLVPEAAPAAAPDLWRRPSGKRVWPRVGGPAAADPATGSSTDRAITCLASSWAEIPPPVSTDPSPPDAVVIVGSGPPAAALAACLASVGTSVVRTDPDGVTGLDRDALRGATDWCLVDLSLVCRSGATAPGPAAAFARLAAGVLHLRRVPGVVLRSVVGVTRGGVNVAGEVTDHRTGPAVQGLLRALRIEFPQLDSVAVDVSDGCGDDELAEAVARVLDRGSGLLSPATRGDAYDIVLAWRGGRWFGRRLLEIEPAAQPISVHGAWIVTGGTRGIGRATALALAAAGAGAIAVVGRTALPPRAEWADLSPDAPHVEEAVRTVLEIEALGVHVLPVCADVSDPAFVERVLELVEQRSGGVQGFVHCAGIPGSGLLSLRELPRSEQVIGVKAAALPVLDRWVSAGRLERVALFSSAVSVFGGLGEADYCAANSLLDAFAEAHHASGRVTSVSWGPWLHDAWSEPASGEAAQDELASYRSSSGLTDEEGTGLLLRLMASGASHVAVLPAGPTAPGRLDPADLDQPRSVAMTERPALRAPYREPATQIEARLAHIWSESVGVHPVGADDPFFELGGNSLIGVAMMRRTESELAVALDPALLFECPTVALLADYVSTLLENDAPVLETVGPAPHGVTS
jgi:polyketide synthase 12